MTSVFHSDNLNHLPIPCTTVPLNLVGEKKKTASIIGISVQVQIFWIVQTMTIGNPICLALARLARASCVSIPQCIRTTEIEGFTRNFFSKVSASATLSVKTSEHFLSNLLTYFINVSICKFVRTSSFMAHSRSS